MLIPEPLNVKRLSAIKYIFTEENVILPKHTHNINNQHVTIVLKGKLLCNFENNSIILNQGDFYDFKEDEQTHELKSLEKNTIILNISKNGINERIDDYDMSEEEEKNFNINLKKFEEEQKNILEFQQKIIKELEEEDRKRGIIK